MDAEWIKSPTARRVLMHWMDSRPAWLWSHDGSALLWRNVAARYFTARIKKSGLKLGPEAVPIKGQVSRLIRLGSLGRSSLSRIQFLAGEKPLATTCSCTPLTLADGEPGLLLVSVDPIDGEFLGALEEARTDAMTRSLLPAGADYLLTSGGRVVEGSPAGLARGSHEVAEGETGDVVTLAAGPDETTLRIWPEGIPAAEQSKIADVRAEEGVSADERPEETHDLADLPEPMLPLGIEPLPVPEPSNAPAAEEWVEPIPDKPANLPLSSLFDRLADDASLYTNLSAADEEFAGPREEPDLIASVIEYADDPETEPDAPQGRSHWMITGRGFRALEPETPPPPAPVEPSTAEAPPTPATVDAAGDAATAERVSRYNFAELGRILTDRVAGDSQPIEPEASTSTRSPQGVISLNAETLVLNRLPLAILVFRDQQVLFANRALTDLLGHESVESLRAAGIASIFPAEDGAGTGPVNRLVRRDGTALSVTARLQSVSWQGRAALMLSASPAEVFRGHEGAVRAFAEIAAEVRDEGFLVADRAGMVTQLSAHGSVLLGRTSDEIVGKPLAVLVSKASMEPLRHFFEKPARFAETARPSLVAQIEDGDTDLTLFAEGQAGIVTGYFGFVRRRARPIAAPMPDDGADPSMLGRLSRGIRRPLNTVIGLADLIRSAALASVDADRHVEYARDIRTAGLEIAVLVDELDDYTRLRDGRYAPRTADVELGALLQSCIVRVKTQAAAARVLVRSAIAEKLPVIRADRASLGQALLNLLASAIDQTPIGGSVILSAQSQDDSSIAIHVRDGAETIGDLSERFVVFRDGVDRDGEQLMPVRSSVGLALTRSLLAVNACSLSVDPTVGVGTLFSLVIPAELVARG